MSAIRLPLSYFRQPITAFRYPVCDIRLPLSGIRWPVSAIRHPVSAIRFPPSASVSRYPPSASRYPKSTTGRPSPTTSNPTFDCRRLPSTGRRTLAAIDSPPPAHYNPLADKKSSPLALSAARSQLSAIRALPLCARRHSLGANALAAIHSPEVLVAFRSPASARDNAPAVMVGRGRRRHSKFNCRNRRKGFVAREKCITHVSFACMSSSENTYLALLHQRRSPPLHVRGNAKSRG